MSYDTKGLAAAGLFRRYRMPNKPTKDIYTALDKAFIYFNERLFDDKLPGCIITWQHRRRAYGYFAGDTWKEVGGNAVTDEIALNPDKLSDRPLEYVLSTLVHEMVHMWQHHFGKPSSNNYHNLQWAEMMESVGLIPSDTGQQGGKRTGYRMTHYIEAGGPFDKACKKLIKAGYGIPWKSLTGESESEKDRQRREKRRASKTKYICGGCGLNAWAKPDVKLKCGECDIQMEARDGDE